MKKDYLKILGEINELHAKYPTVALGRKEIIKDIKKKINEIKMITPVFNAELDELERYYSLRENYISDYNLVMSLLLRLLNNKEEQYLIKEVTTTGYYNTTGSEVNKLFAKITFIVDADLVDKIDDHLYYFDEFEKVAKQIIDNGHSMIIVTNNLFENTVKPKKIDVSCDSVYDIGNNGLKGNITCYVNDNNFKNAIDKLINYIEINGPDFSNIDEDLLFELINNSSKNRQKTLLK